MFDNHNLDINMVILYIKLAISNKNNIILDCGINCHKACKGQVVVDCRVKTSSPAYQYSSK